MSCLRASTLLALLAVVEVMGFGGQSSARAAAGDFPNRPVVLVVPAPAAGGTDIEGRLFASIAQKYLGQPIEVENIVGGSLNSLGTAKVAAARPDGYTLLLSSSDSITIAPHLSRLPYSYKSFIPIAQIDTYTVILVAGPRSPIKSAAALLSYARQHPNQLTVGLSGIAGSTQLGVARVLQALGGIQVRYIPYQGAGQTLAGLLSGSVDLGITSPSSVLSSVQAGKLYPVFVTSLYPVSSMPDVPGAKALGVPGAAYTGWRVIFAPVRTPPEAVQNLNVAFAKALADPDYKVKLSAVGGEGGSNANISDLEKMLTDENASIPGLLRSVLGQK